MFVKKLSILVIATLFLLPQEIYAEDMSAFEILKKSFEVYGGQDSISKLTFVFQEKGQPEKKIIQKRVWKYYNGKDGVNSKVILFMEHPPESKGFAFMTWSYQFGQNKEDEMWMYLPQLRKVRKMFGKEEDDFQMSELKTYDLIPRYPTLDDNKLLKTEKMDGIDSYVIESIPKGWGGYYPYSKAIRWVSKESLLLNRIDYYDKKGKQQKQQNIKWKQVNKAWVWEKIETRNIQNGNKTVLTITDIKIDVGLKDNVFTKRTLQRGFNDTY